MTCRSSFVFRVLFSLTVTANILSCYEQDQTIVKNRPEHLLIANPKPTSRDFERINSEHRVLVAIFDTGVDYNHPNLINNIHFQLDEKGEPTGLGYDYYANDQWASYRVVNTSNYEFSHLRKEVQDEILKTTSVQDYERKMKLKRDQMECEQTELLNVDPRLQKYTEAYRGLESEESSTLHGTHVAGLMTYDLSDVGLVAFRLLPYFQSQQDKKDGNTGKQDKFVQNFKDAVERVSQIKDSNGRGVRLINLSLGGSFKRPNGDDPEEVEKFNRYVKIVTEELADVIKSYPEILFVGAAGNDGGWSDNISRVQYPCGINAENVLCVGATTKDGRKTTFTNVPLNDVHMVFAPGYELKSLSPADRCPFLIKFMDGVLNEKSNGNLCKYDKTEQAWLPNHTAIESRREMIMTVYNTCANEENRYSLMSGTSMAAPVVSRIATEILLAQPDLSVKELIEQIKAKGAPVSSRNFKAYTLNMERPSWQTPENENVVTNMSHNRGPRVAGLNLDNAKSAQELELASRLATEFKGMDFTMTMGRSGLW